ncbi:MAG: caspase family protein [Nitrospirales bacterium]
MMTTAFAEKRVAFVVGIDTYDNLAVTDQLKNAVNDAKAVAVQLRGLGFKVNLGTNLTRTEFNVLWDETLTQVEGGETLVVFFSGHGVELEGQNYLLPRDVPYTQQGRSTLLQRESLSLNILLDDLSMGDRLHPKVSVVMLDACRDNPFVPKGLRAVGAHGGLASVEAPDGIFVIYAAASQTTAFDRLPNETETANSLFTRTLLPLIGRADLSIQELSTKVKNDVWTLADQAGYAQRPTYYDGVIGRFCLPGCAAAVPGSSGHRTASRYRKLPSQEDEAKRLERKSGPRAGPSPPLPPSVPGTGPDRTPPSLPLGLTVQ